MQTKWSCASVFFFRADRRLISIERIVFKAFGTDENATALASKIWHTLNWLTRDRTRQRLMKSSTRMHPLTSLPAGIGKFPAEEKVVFSPTNNAGKTENLWEQVQNRTSFRFSSVREDIAEEGELTVPSAPQSRRGSNFSVSLQPSIQLLQKRKFSFPAALPSNFLGLEGASVGGSARRRFSNVSDAVTRKLSSTIRWRTSEAQCQEIVTVGKSLCSQYIRSRLRRSGYLNKKCGLQRLRSAVSLSGGVLFREVFPDLLGLGVELERMHPKLYINVMRQASSVPGGRITSDKEPGTVLTAVYRELLKTVSVTQVTTEQPITTGSKNIPSGISP